jgi:hypothetical protein
VIASITQAITISPRRLIRFPGALPPKLPRDLRLWDVANAGTSSRNLA